MFRKFGFLAFLLILIFAAYAAAANLIVTGGTVQVGDDTGLVCDDDGVGVTDWGLDTDANEVTSVDVGGIAAACAGNTMTVAILDGAGGVLADASLASISGTSHTFAFAGTDPEEIEGIRIWIEGAN